MVFFWLGFSITFFILIWTWRFGLEKAMNNIVGGADLLPRSKFQTRFIQACFGLVGLYGAAVLWSMFRNEVTGGPVAVFLGIACAVWSANRLNGSLKKWVNSNSPEKQNPSEQGQA